MTKSSQEYVMNTTDCNMGMFLVVPTLMAMVRLSFAILSVRLNFFFPGEFRVLPRLCCAGHSLAKFPMPWHS
jgi:hypothetical protein